MLLGNAVLNLLSTLNQFLVGAGLTAALVCALATVHCPINAYKVKLAITSVKRSGHARIYRATRLLGEIDAKAKSYTADTYSLLERFLAVVL